MENKITLGLLGRANDETIEETIKWLFQSAKDRLHRKTGHLSSVPYSSLFFFSEKKKKNISLN